MSALRAVSPMHAAKLALEEGRPQVAREILDEACKEADKPRPAARRREPGPQEFAQTDDGAALREILALAHAAFRAERSSLWKCDMEAAIEAHGEACENLW